MIRRWLAARRRPAKVWYDFSFSVQCDDEAHADRLFEAAGELLCEGTGNAGSHVCRNQMVGSVRPAEVLS